MEDNQFSSSAPQQPQPPAPPEGQPSQPKATLLGSVNKGVLVAVIISFIALVIGIIAIFSLGSSQEYQGFLQKVETETQQLKESNPSGI